MDYLELIDEESNFEEEIIRAEFEYESEKEQKQIDYIERKENGIRI